MIRTLKYAFKVSHSCCEYRGGAGVVAPSQNLGLSQNMGGAWGSIKRCQKIPVKEFIW